MNDSDSIIPIDDAIKEFRHHLLSHPRTILSAKYGDGKTYFIDKFIEDSDNSKIFLFLRVFPVNYQVLDNKDIFEIVKRDILLQLIYNNLIPSDYDIPNDWLLAFYLQNNSLSLAEDLFKYLPSISVFCNPLSKGATVATGIMSFLRKLYDKFQEYKKDHSSLGAICDFISETDKHFLIEEDIITSIIKDCLNRYRKNNKDKKIVLVFDDMDRIDPAHLFRIMNVLSAQIDYSYRFGISPDYNSTSLNKFGVDNIVLIMDYYNLENLFSHFYGSLTDFKGYIHKFTSSTVFNYSLKHQQYSYMIGQIAKKTEFRESFLKEIFNDNLFDNYSLRDLNNALDNTESQILDHVMFENGGQSVPLPLGPLKLFVILRRLDISESQIKNIYTKAIRVKSLDFLYNAGGYYLKIKKSLGDEIFYISEREDYFRDIVIDSILPDGRVKLYENRYAMSVVDFNTEEILWKYIIDLISK